MPRCLNCNTKFTPKYFLDKHCESIECLDSKIEYQSLKASVSFKKNTKRIAPISDKRKALNKDYEKVRIEILSEAKFKCFIDGCRNIANTCEHRMGRKGFADQWAIDNYIPLLVDKRFLAACCNFHNLELENNPELSKKYQLSKIHGGSKI